MTINSAISKKIYREHVKLYRHINDEYTFLSIIIPHLKKEAESFLAKPPKEKSTFRVVKKGKTVISRRKNIYITNMLQQRIDRGLFETVIISLVSRVETHLQECMRHVIDTYPEKISVLAGEKATIPLEQVLIAKDREQVLSDYIEQKCMNLMFMLPQDYIARFEKLMSIELPAKLISEYIEIKATRDIIIHGDGVANNIYLQKAKEFARADIGEDISIDRPYFNHVVETLKKFAGAIMSRVEQKYS